MNATKTPSPSSTSPYSQGTPAWALPITLVGFLLIFIGERIIGTSSLTRTLISGLGFVTVLGITAYRWWITTRMSEQRRTTERALAILSTLSLLAVLIYFTTAQPFDDWLRVSALSNKTRTRYIDASTCVWVALWVISVLPLILGEIAIHPMRQAECVEWRRVRNAMLAGIGISVAAVYGALFTYGSAELDIRSDFSYFRTSRPSESTRKLAATMTEPIKVLAFFPPVNEVGNEAIAYLEDLRKSSPKIDLQIADRLVSPTLAKDARVTQDGVIVIQRGEQRETISLGVELKNARPALKRLDTDFRKNLMKVVREQRTAYLTVGHGELNDTRPTPENLGRAANGLREILESQHYRVRDLGLIQGLGKDVPEDATLLVVFGPADPFAPEELASLKRYLERGGHLLLAVDPENKSNNDALANIAGLTFKGDTLCNEDKHAVRRHNDSDNAIIYTNKFSIHPSVSTLSRLGSRAMFFLAAGQLDKAPNADAGLTTDFVVRSLPDTFADANGNFKFDSASEKRTTYNLAAAVSRAAASKDVDAAKANRGPADMRAIVISDADSISDAALLNPSMVNGNPQFLMDVLRWLGGEETLSGVEETAEDVRIEHTKQKDRVLFYLTIFGAPTIILGLGLTISRRARKSSKKRAA